MPRALADEKVIAFRLTRHGLRERSSRRRKLADVIPLGLQDTTDHVAAQALALRHKDPRPDDLLESVRDGDLVPTFGPRLAAALLPATSETALIGALLETDDSADDEKDGIPALARELAPYAVECLREKGPLTKEAVGRAIASKVPDPAMQDCDRCARRHPSEALVKTLLWTQRIRLEPDLSARRTGRWAPPPAGARAGTPPPRRSSEPTSSGCTCPTSRPRHPRRSQGGPGSRRRTPRPAGGRSRTNSLPPRRRPRHGPWH